MEDKKKIVVELNDIVCFELSLPIVVKLVNMLNSMVGCYFWVELNNLNKLDQNKFVYK